MSHAVPVVSRNTSETPSFSRVYASGQSGTRTINCKCGKCRRATSISRSVTLNSFHRQHQHRRLGRSRRRQQFPLASHRRSPLRPMRRSKSNLIAIKVEHRGANSARTQQAPDGATDAAEPGHDDRRVLVGNHISAALHRWLGESRFHQSRVRQQQQGCCQHRQRDHGGEATGLASPSTAWRTATRAARRRTRRPAPGRSHEQRSPFASCGKARRPRTARRASPRRCPRRAEDRGAAASPAARSRSGADRDEEQPEQQALERLDVALELVAVLAVGEHHAGEERAERRATARPICISSAMPTTISSAAAVNDSRSRVRGEERGTAGARRSGRRDHDAATAPSTSSACSHAGSAATPWPPRCAVGTRERRQQRQHARGSG